MASVYGPIRAKAEKAAKAGREGILVNPRWLLGVLDDADFAADWIEKLEAALYRRMRRGGQRR